MKMSLGCTRYEIRREMDVPLKISAELVLFDVRWNHSSAIAEAMKKIELMFGGRIDLVRAVPDKARCFYCGVLNETDANICSQCGAPL